MGAGTLIFESVNYTRRGFTTSLIWASSGIGILMSSIVIAILTTCLSVDEISKWGWRIPFLFGAITGVAGFYVRKGMSESNVFRLTKLRKEIVKLPIYAALHSYKSEMIISMGLYVLCSTTTYLIYVFMPIYVSKILGLQFKDVMKINSITMGLMIIMVPVMGYCSDLYGRRILMLTTAFGILFLSYPLYLMMSNGKLITVFFTQFIFAFLIAGFQGPITSAVLEMFPSNIRCSAAAFGYNFSYSLFGGTAPMIVMYLTSKIHNITAPSLYLTFGALIAIISLLCMPKTSRKILG